MNATPPRLPDLPEDWERALVVVAHPDDVEYGAAAAVARWTAQGRTVTYLLATRGEAGIDALDPATCAVVREAEQRAAAARVGVDVVEFLDHADGTVEYGTTLRRDVARVVRARRPQLVVGLCHRERLADGSANQADHRALGLAALDAACDAGNRWVFPELLDEGAQPWDGVRAVAFVESPEPTHALGVDGHLDAAVASLAAHERYLAGLGDARPDPRALLTDVLTAGGPAAGTTLGLTFETFAL